MAAKGLIVRGSTGKWEVTPDGADYWVKAVHGNAGNGTLTWTDKIFEVFEDFREWDANRKA